MRTFLFDDKLILYKGTHFPLKNNIRAKYLVLNSLSLILLRSRSSSQYTPQDRRLEFYKI